jgi:hypothetical protein
MYINIAHGIDHALGNGAGGEHDPHVTAYWSPLAQGRGSKPFFINGTWMGGVKSEKQ